MFSVFLNSSVTDRKIYFSLLSYLFIFMHFIFLYFN
jgi:hypothetical protein